MRLHNVALKNIVRRKGKMALIVAGLAIGVSTLVAIITITLAFQKNIDKQLDTYGFNIIVYPASSNLSLSYGGMTVSGVDAYEAKTLTDDDLDKIKRMPSAGKITAISPKLLQLAEINGKRALLIGTDFSRELSIKKWWQIHGKKPSSPNEVIAGSDAVKNLKLQVGDSIQLAGQEFKVSAVLQSTGSQDDSLIFGDLNKIQSIYGRDQELSLIEISAKNSGDIESVVRDLEKSLPNATVSSVKQAVKYKERTVESLAKFGLTVSMIVVLISGLIVFTTMASSVNERKREIGVFRAIGYRQSTVAQIILLEAFILSLVGGLIGYIAGFGLIFMLPVFLKKLALIVNINVLVLVLSIGLSIIVGLLSSLLPARRAANMDPADALKSL